MKIIAAAISDINYFVGGFQKTRNQEEEWLIIEIETERISSHRLKDEFKYDDIQLYIRNREQSIKLPFNEISESFPIDIINFFKENDLVRNHNLNELYWVDELGSYTRYDEYNLVYNYR
jgi:hypothetical protein